jgi:predicted nucleic acid-binding protein
MKRLTIDSSVIIASLLNNEPRHREALRIWEGVLSGKNSAVMPYSVFVEVVAAIKRRTGMEKLALNVKNELLNIETVSFVVLDDKAAEDAAHIAVKTGCRGMDALVIQVAKEFDTELVSFDKDMMTKAAKSFDS